MCEAHQRVVRRPAWKEKKSPLGSEMEFPGGSDGKDSACNAGDPSLIPGWEDPLEKEMATRSSILAWRTLWMEEPGEICMQVRKQQLELDMEQQTGSK